MLLGVTPPAVCPPPLLSVCPAISLLPLLNGKLPPVLPLVCVIWDDRLSGLPLLWAGWSDMLMLFWVKGVSEHHTSEQAADGNPHMHTHAHTHTNNNTLSYIHQTNLWLTLSSGTFYLSLIFSKIFILVPGALLARWKYIGWDSSIWNRAPCMVTKQGRSRIQPIRSLLVKWVELNKILKYVFFYSLCRVLFPLPI